MSFKSVLTFVLIFSTNLLNAQWMQTNHPPSTMIHVLACSGNNIISGTFDGNVFITNDNGDHWNSINTGHTYSYLYAILVTEQNIFISTDIIGVYLTTNNGATWSLVNNGLQSSVDSFTKTNQIIFAGTGAGDIYATTNNGAEWKLLADNLVIYSSITSLVGNGNYVIAGSDGPGIFVSSNSGLTWNQSNNGISSYYIYTLTRDVNNIYAGTYNGVFKSTNNGNQWNKISDGMINTHVNILLADSNNIFSGNEGGVYLLRGGTEKWIAINDGLNNLNITSLAVNNDYIFAGVYNGTVWRRPLSEIITNVIQSDLPNAYYLSQNYPNPFNPTTTIKYSIPFVETRHGASLRVSLKVYDMLGREVATLVNEEKQPGNFELKFDGSNLSSGVYFYRLQAGSFSETKKFVLMK